MKHFEYRIFFECAGQVKFGKLWHTVLGQSCLYVHWTYKTNEPCPSVCLSIPRCTTLYGRVLAYPSMDFSFGTWNKHILELCLVVLFLKYLKNCNFGDFLKNGDFGDLA